MIWVSHIQRIILLKTTLNLNDHILRRAKRHARRRGTTLTRFVEDALRAKLMDDSRGPPDFRLVLKAVRGHAPPNVDISDREALYDVIDQG